MSNFLASSSLFAVVLTLAAYEVSRLLQKKLKWAILNPILVGAILVGVVLAVARIPNDDYQEGCELINWLLTPATVCLALPLHAQVKLLEKDWRAIAAGIVGGTLTSLVCVWGMSRLFVLEETLYCSMLPKSVTTAMGMAISESGGGIAAVTTAAIILTGIIGGIVGPSLIKLLHLTHPVAQGVAIGTAAHVVGTAKAAEFGETAEAVSSLALVVAGVLTAILFPVFTALP